MAEAGNSEQTVDQEIVGEKTETLDKWLLALKEDLASWISRLLKIDLTVDSFTSVLDTGVILCRLANFIQNTGDQFFINNSGFVREGVFPLCGITFKERGASQGSFIARDNVCNFIRWCRELGVPDVIMFETEDLVSNKNEKAVLLTLLEVARKVFKVGVDPPELVRLENEIDKELENESEPTPPIKVTALKKKHKSHSLDDLVSENPFTCKLYYTKTVRTCILLQSNESPKNYSFFFIETLLLDPKKTKYSNQIQPSTIIFFNLQSRGVECFYLLFFLSASYIFAFIK